jgi:tetratricopeptide (TPR) repeat protein
VDLEAPIIPPPFRLPPVSEAPPEGAMSPGEATSSSPGGTTRLARIAVERKAFTVGSDENLPIAVARGRDPNDFSALTGGVVEAVGARTLRNSVPQPPVLSAPPAGGATFGEIDLGAAPVPSAPPPQDDPLGVGAAPPMAPPAPFDADFDSYRAPATSQPSPPKKPERKPLFREIRPDPPPVDDLVRRKRMRYLFTALGVLGVLLVLGAGLSLTPFGAFGKNWFDDQIHGPARREAATRVVQLVDRSLERDTYDRAMGALRRLDQAIERVPQEKELRAYAVYANNLVVARFGADATRTGRARLLLSKLSDAPPGMRYLNLARAADALSRNNFREVARLTRNDPGARDLATLAAFAQGDQAQTLRAARAGRDRRPTPRSRYLLARAMSDLGDRDGAVREAQEVLEFEPRHAGARILLARLVGSTPTGRERALDLLRDLVRDAAPGTSPGRSPPRPTAAAGPNSASPTERADANVVAGQVEFSRENLQLAERRFQRALEYDPRSASALVGLGAIYLRRSNFTDALARFHSARSASPDNLDAVIGEAQASLALTQTADAKAVLEPALRAHPNDGRLHFWMGKAHAAGRDGPLAEREFGEAIRLQPDSLEPYVALSELLSSLQRNDAAEQVLLDAATHVPDGAALHRARSRLRFNRGDLAGAEQEILIAVQRDRDDLGAHFQLGEIYRLMQRLDDANREFELVARREVDYPGLALARGLLAEARGELPQALITFREALQRNPESVELIVRLAATLIQLNNFGEADGLLSRVTVNHPTHAEAQYLLGRARLGAGNFLDAVHYLDRAMELNPQRADFKAYCAEAHWRTGDILRAIQLAQQSIELDRTFPRGYWVRASIQVHQGAARQALEDIRRATQYDPQFWAAYATGGEVNDALGHPEEAVTAFRIATEHDPNHGDWFYHLGRLHADAGRAREARTALERSVSLGRQVRPVPTWYVQSLRLLGDLVRDQNARLALEYYRQYLTQAPPNTEAFRAVQNAVQDLELR